MGLCPLLLVCHGRLKLAAARWLGQIGRQGVTERINRRPRTSKVGQRIPVSNSPRKKRVLVRVSTARQPDECRTFRRSGISDRAAETVQRHSREAVCCLEQHGQAGVFSTQRQRFPLQVRKEFRDRSSSTIVTFCTSLNFI